MLQYGVEGDRSLKSVPPTARLYGVEASPFTANPLETTALVVPGSVAAVQPATPESSEETVIVMPSVTACSYMDAIAAFVDP